MKEDFIVKSFDCLSCKHCTDWDCNFDEDHWFACEFDELPKGEYKGKGCPHYEEKEGKGE